MAQQSARLDRKNKMYSWCLEHAFMIWFWSANSRRPRSSIAASGAGDGSIRPCANLLQKRPALGGASTDEYMAVIALDCSPGRTRSERLGLDESPTGEAGRP